MNSKLFLFIVFCLQACNLLSSGNTPTFKESRIPVTVFCGEKLGDTSPADEKTTSFASDFIQQKINSKAIETSGVVRIEALFKKDSIIIVSHYPNHCVLFKEFGLKE